LPDPVPPAVVSREKFLPLARPTGSSTSPNPPTTGGGRGTGSGTTKRWCCSPPWPAAGRSWPRRKPRPGARFLTDCLPPFDADLPFTLTAGQAAIGKTLAAELARDSPMNRLLQGEVGSGKTIVALRAMLQVVDAGGQAALLAPTEVLAAQHYESIRRSLGPLSKDGLLGGLDAAAVQVTLLTGSMPTAARKQAMLDAASGTAGIIIGTHALLSGNVAFYDLGLIVVDEQHRFGVEQRDALRAKARKPPHLLVMTATPIPRTVAMTVFGDLETSVLDELPAGRAPISTHLVGLAENPAWAGRIWSRSREEIDNGHQVYVVCPKIGTDDDGDFSPGEADLAPMALRGKTGGNSRP
jgi:ATP-dependent DNA helicase RecG